MSQYIEFYIRVNDTFIPIADYSRNTYLFIKHHNYFPYEKVITLTVNLLNDLRYDVTQDIASTKKEIALLEKRKSFVADCNNSLEEKMLEVDSIDEQIDVEEDDFYEQNKTLNFVDFLRDLICSVKYSENSFVDSDNYLYAGIEVSNPTIDDIIIQ